MSEERDALIKTSLERLRELAKPEGRDQEANHVEADAILLNIISAYGHPEIVDAFNNIEMWYA